MLPINHESKKQKLYFVMQFLKLTIHFSFLLTYFIEENLIDIQIFLLLYHDVSQCTTRNYYVKKEYTQETVGTIKENQWNKQSSWDTETSCIIGVCFTRSFIANKIFQSLCYSRVMQTRMKYTFVSFYSYIYSHIYLPTVTSTYLLSSIIG